MVIVWDSKTINLLSQHNHNLFLIDSLKIYVLYFDTNPSKRPSQMSHFYAPIFACFLYILGYMAVQGSMGDISGATSWRKLTFPISQLSISNHFFTRNGTYYLDFVWIKLNSMHKSSLNSYLLEIVLNLMRNFTSYQDILVTFTPECKYFQISHYCCPRVHSWVRCMSVFFFSHVYDTS